MQESRNLVIVLPGGSSPFHPKGKGRYDSLREVSALRGLNLWIVDYVGYGRYPVLGTGFDILVLSEYLAMRFSRVKEPYTLLASCLGILACGYLLAHHARSLENCRQLVFWGSSARHCLDRMALKYPYEEVFNKQKGRSSGFALCNGFWRQTQSLCALALHFLHPIKSILVFGAEDEQTDIEYMTEVKENMLPASQRQIVETPGGHDFSTLPNINMLLDCVIG